MEGFITLHRKLLEWEWYDHTNTKVLFIHCLLKANHKTAKWRGFDIKRGEFITSISNLSRETGLTVKQVRIALDNLVNTGELGKQSTSSNTTISVLKYDNYQTKGKPSGKVEANQGQGKGKVRATTNNDNNEVNEIKEKKKTFNFRLSLIELGIQDNIAEEWIKVRKTKKAVNSEIAFNAIKKQIELCNITPNECITKAVENSWSGFKAEWIKEETKQNNNSDVHSRVFF